VFAISKLAWIKQQQKKLRAQEREAEREHIERESHYLWGKRYLLSVKEVDGAPGIELKHSRMVLNIRPGASDLTRQAVVAQFYRDQIKAKIPALLEKWEPKMRVAVKRFFVQKMKTKWGSCNPTAGSIRLNTDLAKKPAQCLEYVLVHELAHLLERHHNARFVALMDSHMPHWRQHRETLNRSPLAHQDWVY